MIGYEGTLSLRCSPVVSLKVELRLYGWIISGKIGSWLILKFDFFVVYTAIRCDDLDTLLSVGNLNLII